MPAASEHLPADARRYPRHDLGLYSELEIEGLRYRCHIVDISVAGARVGDLVVAAGERVALYLGTAGWSGAVAAEVVWSRGNQAGLRFLERLPQA